MGDFVSRSWPSPRRKPEKEIGTLPPDHQFLRPKVVVYGLLKSCENTETHYNEEHFYGHVNPPSQQQPVLHLLAVFIHLQKEPVANPSSHISQV